MTLTDIRDSDGKLPAYAWPGGYPVVYMEKDNGILCPKCANEYNADRDNEDQLQPVAYFIHYEGPAEQCERCNAEIESAYGEVEGEEL
jgi:hypothetical protein